MKVSHNWLKQYIPLAHEPSAVREALTMLGFEVDEVSHLGPPLLNKVVVGEVVSREPHPNADRLGVCKVDIGSVEPLQIVCGASNFKVGDRVPVAQVGSILPGNFKIKPSKIRGVSSAGMMCSAKELSIGEDQAGLLLLKTQPTIGTPINEVFSDNDTVYEVEITPNRPDCLSHIGIARELAAYFSTTVTYPSLFSGLDQLTIPDSPLLDKIEWLEKDACPLYSAYCIRNVRVGPSPKWLKTSIESIGLRSINNIVDVTNFVLWELGQPLHVFDAEKISNRQLFVRYAKTDDRFIGLDGKVYLLNNKNLIIADAQKTLAIAGVIGGKAAEVDSHTTSIVLEAAFFEPFGIRTTARNIGISTDSSYHFERGVDSHGVYYAALRAIDLIIKVSGGSLEGPFFQKGNSSIIEHEISIDPDYIRNQCGYGPDNEKISEIFESLELKVREIYDPEGKIKWLVKPPTFRTDLVRRSDLIEEFVRIYGCDKIPSAPVFSLETKLSPSPIAKFTKLVADFLTNQYGNECYNYSLINGSSLERLDFSQSDLKSLQVENPLSQDQDTLRPTLLLGLIDNIAYNQSNGNYPDFLFELGKVFRVISGKLTECISVAWVQMKNNQLPHWSTDYSRNIFDIKKQMIYLLKIAGISVNKLSWVSQTLGGIWEPKHWTSAVKWEQGFEANLGTLNTQETRFKGVNSIVFGAELVLSSELLKRSAKKNQFKPYSKQPKVNKDLALAVNKEVTAATIHLQLKKIALQSLPRDIELIDLVLFDIYFGSGIQVDQKSLGFTFIFQAVKRTLKDQEVNIIFENIQKLITQKYSYKIRK